MATEWANNFRMMNSGRPKSKANPTVLSGFSAVKTHQADEKPKKQQESTYYTGVMAVGAFILIVWFLRK